MCMMQSKRGCRRVIYRVRAIGLPTCIYIVNICIRAHFTVVEEKWKKKLLYNIIIIATAVAVSRALGRVIFSMIMRKKKYIYICV